MAKNKLKILMNKCIILCNRHRALSSVSAGFWWRWFNWFPLRRADQPGHVLWAHAEKVLARVVRGGGGHVLRRREREQQQQQSRRSAGLGPLLQDWHAGGQRRQQSLRGTLAHAHPRLRPLPLWLRRGHGVGQWHSAKRGVDARPGGLTE